MICGDGCLMEGISQETLALAGHLKLNKLIVFWDNNGISIDGKVSLADSTDQVARFQASGWNAFHIDGHDPDAIAAAHRNRAEIRQAHADRRQDHHRLRRADQGRHQGRARLAARQGRDRRRAQGAELGFCRPSSSLMTSCRPGARPALRGAAPRAEWEKRARCFRRPQGAISSAALRASCPSTFDDAIAAYKQKLAADKPKVATRKSSEMALEVINGTLPETLGGSADLTPSNNTKTSQMLDAVGRQLRQPLRALRHPRARHGGGHQRHRAP